MGTENIFGSGWLSLTKYFLQLWEVSDTADMLTMFGGQQCFSNLFPNMFSKYFPVCFNMLANMLTIIAACKWVS